MKNNFIRNINLKIFAGIKNNIEERRFIGACKFVNKKIKKLHKTKDANWMDFKDDIGIYFQVQKDADSLHVSKRHIWNILEHDYKLNTSLIELCITLTFIKKHKLKVNNITFWLY